MNKMNKIAIIGAGASAVGTIIALKKLGIKNENITIFNSDNKKKTINTNLNFKDLIKKNDLKTIYKILKKKFSLKIINKKTSAFSYLENINKKNDLFDNNFEFGFTNFWGGSVQIFDESSAKKNFFNYPKLLKGYEKILNYIYLTKGIYLNDALKKKIIKNGQIKLEKNLEILSKNFKNTNNINCTINSIAINLKKYDGNKINIIDNLIGSNNNNIFNSEIFFKDYKDIIFENKVVKKISINDRVIFAGKNYEKKFNKIFFCAGPYYTQKILGDSLDELKSYKVKDSYTFTVPLIYVGKQNAKREDYFSLTNLIVNIKKNFTEIAQVQIYPPQKHFFYSIINHNLWKSLKWIYKYIFKRVYFARVYLTDEYCITRYFDCNARTTLIKKKIPNKDNLDKINNFVINEIKSALSNTGFKILNIKIPSKTSAHYAGQLDIEVSKKLIEKKIFINDTSNWNYLPSYSPTFTIIAQAYINTLKIFK